MDLSKIRLVFIVKLIICIIFIKTMYNVFETWFINKCKVNLNLF